MRLCRDSRERGEKSDDKRDRKLERLERRAREDNELTQEQWDDLPKGQKDEMRMEAKIRAVFLRTIDVTILLGLPIAGVLVYWVDQLDAEGELGYNA